jgi:Flp pilus assembly protein TadD
VQYRNGDLAEAAKILRQAVAVDSESYLGHYLLGMTLNDQGDREGARREVQRSLELKSDYAPAVQLDGELREATPKPAPKAAE